MRNRILSLLFLLPFISESVSAALVEEKDYVAYLFTYLREIISAKKPYVMG